ncbi:hypothetical protein LMG29660_03007 [Burkholderia puraquae]|uniref:Uncharacterized protein n=1 Tax=Burkholderia puraquae TaxID=1904757 RepID=A0A6J5DSV7_9BURK|nr:hypothetical protein LMG29660_03007 [Burkholderia puraquae]
MRVSNMSKRSYSRNALPLCQKGIGVRRQTAIPLIVFMLLKTRPEWLGRPVPER